jgi:hypothetical protein
LPKQVYWQKKIVSSFVQVYAQSIGIIIYIVISVSDYVIAFGKFKLVPLGILEPVLYSYYYILIF